VTNRAVNWRLRNLPPPEDRDIDHGIDRRPNRLFKRSTLFADRDLLG